MWTLIYVYCAMTVGGAVMCHTKYNFYYESKIQCYEAMAEINKVEFGGQSICVPSRHNVRS